MVIEVVIFFIWVLIVCLVGLIVVVRGRKRRRLQGVDNVSKELTFPQRHWLPICLIVAVVSPLAVKAYKAVTTKKPEVVSVDRNGAAYQGGDTTVKDTAYHVATPPQH